jgi:ABC-2 type transport system ATP-binding protein
MTTVIRLTGVSKRFVIRKDKSLKERVVNRRRSNHHKDDFWALRDVSLEFESGTTNGLIGPNGSGKSTLLKVIGGIIETTSGTVERRGRLAALLELGAGFHADLTGRENVYLNSSILGLSRADTDRHFEEIVDFSGIEPFIDTQVKFYSSGMYVRLAFAVAVHVDPDVLLVDEVLAVGDEPFQRKCMDRIRKFQQEGRTIVLVTHALEQVGELCDRTVVLEGGRTVFDGDAAEALTRLRNDYEVARQEDLARVDAASNRPASGAMVEAVRLLGADGRRCSSVRPGDDLVVEVDVRAMSPLRDWVLGIGLDTPLGQLVWGTHSGLLGEVLPRLAAGERRQFRYLLPDLQLGQGTYYVHAAIAERKGPELARLAQAAMLSVMASSSSVGPLRIEARLIDQTPQVSTVQNTATGLGTSPG